MKRVLQDFLFCLKLAGMHYTTFYNCKLCPTTLSIMTFSMVTLMMTTHSIMTFSIVTLNMTTLNMTTHSMTTLSMTTFSIKSIKQDNQHDVTQQKWQSVTMLSVTRKLFILSAVMLIAECYYAQCPCTVD